MSQFREWIDVFQAMPFLRHLLGYTLQLAPVYYLVLYPFRWKIPKKNLQKFTLSAVLVFCFYMAVMCVTELGFYPETQSFSNPGPTFLNISFRLGLIIMYAVYIILIKADLFYKISLIVLVSNYRLLLTITVNIMCKLMPLKGQEYTYPYRLDVVIFYVILQIITFPLVLWILKKFSEVIAVIPEVVLHRKIFIMVPISSVIFLTLIYAYIVYAETVNAPLMIFVIVSYVFISLIHTLLFIMIKETAMRYENYIQLYSLRMTYEKMSQHIEGLRRIKHETQSRLAYLQICLQNGKYDEIEKMLHEMSELPVLSEPSMYCEDYLINGILNYAMSGSEAAELRLIAKIGTTQYAPLTRIELTSIFLNLLNNAVRELSHLPEDADEEDKCIHLVMTKVNGELLIACRNRLLHEIDKLPGQRILSHYHRRQPEHGLGLSILSNIAEKYGGRMNVTDDENFTVSLFIPAEESEPDSDEAEAEASDMKRSED